MNRRTFMREAASKSVALGGIAIGVAALTGQCSPTEAPAAERGTLLSLIEAHRKASDAWCEASVAASLMERGTAERKAAELWDGELYQDEQAALQNLLAYRPTDLSEVHRLMGYLTGPAGPWEGCVPNEVEIEAIFAALTPEAGR